MNGLPDYKFINTFFIQVPTATNTTFNQTQCLTSFRQGNAQKKKKNYLKGHGSGRFASFFEIQSDWQEQKKSTLKTSSNFLS